MELLAALSALQNFIILNNILEEETQLDNDDIPEAPYNQLDQEEIGCYVQDGNDCLDDLSHGYMTKAEGKCAKERRNAIAT